jgi:hypothetical protein
MDEHLFIGIPRSLMRNYSHQVPIDDDGVLYPVYVLAFAFNQFFGEYSGKRHDYEEINGWMLYDRVAFNRMQLGIQILEIAAFNYSNF